MKLNIGCGHVILPLADREHVPFGKHLEPLDDFLFEPGWVNVDKFTNPGVDETCDLFIYPWIRGSNGNPFNDDSADMILASHIMEHIPHRPWIHEGLPTDIANKYYSMAKHLDGWFLFMYECWRILKPDGELHVRCPWPWSIAGISDPSHTRLVLPGTFSYTGARNPDAPFDYHIPLQFEIVDGPRIRFNRMPENAETMSDYDVTMYALGNLSVADEFRLILKAVKD